MTEPRTFLDGRVILHHGDNREVLKGMADNSIDLFAGTGTTAEACFREGFCSILIEREAEYIKDIERRMSLVMEGPITRSHTSMKARGRPVDNGPLFANEAAE